MVSIRLYEAQRFHFIPTIYLHPLKYIIEYAVHFSEHVSPYLLIKRNKKLRA